MKEKLAINIGKLILALKHRSIKKNCFSWCLGPFFRRFEGKYCAVSENIFLCLLCIYTFPIASLIFYEYIELGLKLGLQWAQFWSWLQKQQIPRNLRAWLRKKWLLKSGLKKPVGWTVQDLETTKEWRQHVFGTF